MKILLLNQAFFPDVVSSAQHLADLAADLAERGHQVTVIAGRRSYDQPGKCFAKHETWRNVRIERVTSTGFGKATKCGRVSDLASFLWCCWWRGLRLPRQHLVVALTSPPLISLVGGFLARLWRARLIHWVMDLNPDEAVAAGWLRAGSAVTRVLDRVSRWALRQAELVVALDRFMFARLLEKGVHAEQMVVLPPWSHETEVRFDPIQRERFRKQHGLAGKFVVMYSGNHSPCHPLDTVLAAARELAHQRDIVFCFVGGGTQFRRIERMCAEYLVASDGLAQAASNIRCLPYQPLRELSGSLSAADLHVVVMGDCFVGLVHPCKIYNIMRVAAPVAYIGPRESPVGDVLNELEGRGACASFRHGEAQRLVEWILHVRNNVRYIHRTEHLEICAQFSRQEVLPMLITHLEGRAGPNPKVTADCAHNTDKSSQSG